MHVWSPSRRRLLQAGAALGTAGLAGCPDVIPTDCSNDALQPVPAAASAVAFVDVDALLADEVLRAHFNDYLAAAGDAAATVPSTVGDVLNTATDAAGLDPRSLSTVVAFGSYGAEGPTGVVARANWSTADVRSALSRNGARVESATYGDAALLLGEGVAVGIPSDGTFAVGDRSTAERVIDVVAGDAPPLDGRARQAFEAAADGAIRVAAVPPADLDAGAAASTFDPAAVRAISHAYGAYVIDGDERRSSFTVETDDADATATLRTDLEVARANAVTALQERVPGGPLFDELATDFAAVDVAADGTAVVVEADDGTVLPTLPLALFSSFLLGLGTGSRQPATPAVEFQFEYEADAGTLTITHVAGDSVRANAVSIRGEHLATGSWRELGGEASGQVGDGDPTVVAGDAVTLDADPDYLARVVWIDEGGSGDASATLAEDRGPAA